MERCRRSCGTCDQAALEAAKTKGAKAAPGGPPPDDEDTDISGYGHRATAAESARIRAAVQSEHQLWLLLSACGIVTLVCCALRLRGRRMPWERAEKLQEKCAV
jgi:hypothetical protein